MTDIVKNSKLIANYLGWKYVPFSPDSKIKAGWYKPAIGYSKGSVPHKDGKFWTHTYRNHNELRFYNSFDALIPAIEKLESENLEEYFYNWVDDRGTHNNFMNIGFSRYDEISDFCIEWQLDPPTRIGVGEGKGIIKDTFKAVVEVIKFVNNLKENKDE